MLLQIMNTSDPKKLDREIRKLLDDRSVIERLLDRADEQAAERAASKPETPNPRA